ncbi:MAG: glycosyltransferase [Pseudomonadota bacterium]
MAEVEIILGTKDGARHLGPQLASFAGQSLQDWTLLVSDDGSTDGTCAMVARFGTARPATRLRLALGPGAGVAANYLSLLRQADPNARAIALSDQDDVWFPDKLARALAALRHVPRGCPALYAARSVLIDAQGLPLRRARQKAFHPSFANALVQNVAPGNTIVLNRAAADLAARAQPPGAPPFHDWWLYALISGASGAVILDAAPVLAYRQHGESVLGAHAGLAASARRAALLAGGQWRKWLDQHHAALASVAPHLTPGARAQLAAIRAARPRPRALAAARAYRQGPVGAVVMALACRVGLA